MDASWFKILSVVFLVLLLVYLFPRAKHMMQNSPKAEKGDWQAAVVPLLGVVGFIALLAWLVSQ
ncbi:MAG: hypothetical protein AAGB35_05660 [Pseudomonadota bacterium]